MSEHTAAKKSQLEKLRDVLSQLKEMEHYSVANLKKLTEFWMAFEEGEEKNPEFAEEISLLMDSQTDFEKEITKLIENIEFACNRMT